MEPYDLPVKTSGGIEEHEVHSSTPLQVSVQIPQGEVAEELVDELEGEIAFTHYADLKSCESEISGWEANFAVGTVMFTFTLTTVGQTQDVELALTTGDPPQALTNCLGRVIQDMQLAVAPGEQPVTVHLMLRYGE